MNNLKHLVHQFRAHPYDCRITTHIERRGGIDATYQFFKPAGSPILVTASHLFEIGSHMFPLYCHMSIENIRDDFSMAEIKERPYYDTCNNAMRVADAGGTSVARVLQIILLQHLLEDHKE